MFSNIQAYRNLNRALRLSIWLGLIAFVTVDWIIDGVPIVMLVIMFVLIIIQDAFTDGGSLVDTRVFIADPDARESIHEFAMSNGFREIEGEATHYAKRSKYLRVYLINIHEKDGRLIVSAPKKFAEQLYSLGTANLSPA